MTKKVETNSKAPKNEAEVQNEKATVKLEAGINAIAEWFKDGGYTQQSMLSQLCKAADFRLTSLHNMHSVDRNGVKRVNKGSKPYAIYNLKQAGEPDELTGEINLRNQKYWTERLQNTMMEIELLEGYMDVATRVFHEQTGTVYARTDYEKGVTTESPSTQDAEATAKLAAEVLKAAMAS